MGDGEREGHQPGKLLLPGGNLRGEAGVRFAKPIQELGVLLDEPPAFQRRPHRLQQPHRRHRLDEVLVELADCDHGALERGVRSHEKHGHRRVQLLERHHEVGTPRVRQPMVEHGNVGAGCPRQLQCGSSRCRCHRDQTGGGEDLGNGDAGALIVVNDEHSHRLGHSLNRLSRDR